MKYTIEGLQQDKLLEWGLDAGDAVILRFLIDFYHTEKMKKLELEGVKYFWVHYQTILNEIPILKIGRPALRNRFKKYVNCGLMDFYLEKTSQGTYTYYRFIEKKYIDLLFNTKNPHEVKEHPHPKSTSTPVQSQLRPKDSSTIDSSTNIYISENSSLDNNNYNTIKDTIESSIELPKENSLDIYSPLKTKEEENSSKETINSTSTNTRMQNKLIPVLRAWQNCRNLRQHKDSTAFRKLGKKHLDIVEDLGYDETVRAIQSYSKILASKDHYYSHPFALWNFLGRAVEEFLDSSKPFEMFEKKRFVQEEFEDPYPDYEEQHEAIAP